MSDTLKVFGTTYTNVAGIKATDGSNNSNTLTYVRPTGSQTLTSNDTYDVTGLASVIVNVPAAGTDVSDTTATAGDVLATKYFYTSSGVKTEGTIASKSSSDLTENGATVTAPAGYYSSAATKTIASGSAATPATTISVTPSISVNSSGLITASVSGSQSVTPTVSAGYVSSGTSGNVTVSGSNTEQLTTQAATTYTPTTTDQTLASGTYLTGTQTISGDANLVSGNIKSGTSIFGVSGSYSGTDVSDTTATASDVLAGTYFYTSSGVKTEGTIVDKSGTNQAAGSTYQSTDYIRMSVPAAGYYDTSSTIYRGLSTFGNATTDDVLSGKTFTSTEGLAAEGTMADISGAQRLGTKFTSTNYLGLYPNTAGYYDTTSRVVLARADFGDAVASDVVSGKTFTSSAGWTVTGTYSPNIVQGTFTTGSTRAGTGTTTISYSGSGYPIALMVYVDGGAYNNSTGGNTTWYDSVDRYDVGAYYMTKARIPAAPTYTTSAAANYGVTAIIYKNSTSTSTSYTRTSSMTANAYTSSSTDAAASTVCVRFKGNGTTLSWYVGNATSSTIGLAPSTTYAYIAVYSS